MQKKVGTIWQLLWEATCPPKSSQVILLLSLRSLGAVGTSLLNVPESRFRLSHEPPFSAKQLILRGKTN